DAYIENFVFYIGANASKETYNNIYEQCVAEQPSPNVYWNSTILHMGGGWAVNKSIYHRASVLRGNYVNAQIVYGQRCEVSGITYDSGTKIATLTTKTPHGQTAPGNVSLQGILVNGSADNAFNGVFGIEDTTTNTIL